MKPPPLQEKRDYYIDRDGRYVFTAYYLLRRGECCYSGCRHCPYGFSVQGSEDDESKLVKDTIASGGEKGP